MASVCVVQGSHGGAVGAQDRPWATSGMHGSITRCAVRDGPLIEVACAPDRRTAGPPVPRPDLPFSVIAPKPMAGVCKAGARGSYMSNHVICKRSTRTYMIRCLGHIGAN